MTSVKGPVQILARVCSIGDVYISRTYVSVSSREQNLPGGYVDRADIRIEGSYRRRS